MTSRVAAATEIARPPACRICQPGSPVFVFRHAYKAVNLANVDAPRVELSFWRCRSCGVVFTEPPDRDASLALYEHLYEEAARECAPSPINRARYAEWLARLQPYRRTGHLFESGFGRGGFLRAAIEAGWACSGNEISARACELAASVGVQVFRGDIASVDAPAHHDLVVSLGALEHTMDPHRQVQHYRRLLRPGGAVVISTPNYNSLSRLVLGRDCRMFDPEHVSYFTPASLRTLLRKTGFTVMRIWTQNVNVHEIRARFRRGNVDKQGVYDAYQELRTTLESRPLLRIAKRAANAAASALGVGEELYALAERPDR